MKHIELQDMAFNSFNNTIAGVGANAQSDKVQAPSYCR